MTKRKNKILLLPLIVGIFGMIPLFAEDNKVSWDWKPSWRMTNVLVQNQLPDGNWDRGWSKTGEKGTLYNDIVLDKIMVVGHHLEWIALLPEFFDVPKGTIQKALKGGREELMPNGIPHDPRSIFMRPAAKLNCS